MFSGTVATFTAQDLRLTPGDFTVTVDWGDGSPPDIVTPTGDPATGWLVPGSHRYRAAGGYKLLP